MSPMTLGERCRHVFREAAIVELAVSCHAPAAADAARNMLDLAHARARPGPVITTGGRRLDLEAAEELADGCNYLVWHRQARAAADAGADELDAIDRSIAALAVAWQGLALAMRRAAAC